MKAFLFTISLSILNCHFSDLKSQSVDSENKQNLIMMINKIDVFKKEYQRSYDYILGGSISSIPNNDKFEKLRLRCESLSKSDSEVAELIKKGDAYFDDFFPNSVVPELKKYIKEKSYFDSTKWMKDSDVADIAIKDLQRAFDYHLTNAASLSRNDDWIQEIKQMYANQKQKIMDYKNNGGMAAYKEKEMLEKADKVMPTKSIHNDPEIVAFVKKAHKPDYYGAIQKVIVVTDWKIEKDKLNRPIEKYKAVEIITKKDGKCYLITSTVYMEHEGGGKYGVKKLSRYLDPQLMNCNNVK